VPAVLISPRIAQPHSVDHSIYDHTSVLRTVMDCFLGGNVQPNALGNRAAAATPLNPTLGAASSDAPNLSVPAVPEGKPTEDGLLTDFQKAIVRAAWLRLKQLGASAALAEPAFTTKLQSEAELQRLASTVPQSETP
jgi:hypothetical protein